MYICKNQSKTNLLKIMFMKTTFRIFILSVLGLLLFTKIAKTQSTTATNTYSSSNFLGWGTTSGDLWFKVNNTTQMTLQNSTGYFGVGTSSPEYRLHVSGTSYNGSCLLLERSETNAYGTSLIFRSKKTLWGAVSSGISIGNISFMGPTSTTNTYASGASILASTTESWTSGHGAKLTFSTTANGSTTSTERLVIDNNGYVGINQTTPGSMLDVKGTLRLSGSASGYVGFSPAAAAGSTIYTLPSADGDSGQFLHTDGSGTLSWQTPTTSTTAWQLTGNSGAYHTLGTTDNNSFDLITNNQSRIIVGASGLIQIARTYGERVTIGEGGGAIQTNPPNLQVGGDVVFYEPRFGITEAPCIRGGHTFSTSAKPDYSWYYDNITGIFHPENDAIAFSSNGKEAMRVKLNNVGIGTTSPVSLLHVAVNSGSSLGSDAALFTYGPDSNYTGKLFIVPKLNHYSYDSLSVSGDQGIFWSDNSGTDTSSGLVIAPYCNKYNGIRITADGNVGIGTPLTSNPQNYKLAVNGFIGAKEVYVENTSTTWPDYVFSNDYNLPSLNDVEKFVNQNKHLPDVPSAAEVAEKGQAVGEMNAVLLKKVEELTLYIIEQNKRMDEQQRKIQELESKINRQQNQ